MTQAADAFNLSREAKTAGTSTQIPNVFFDTCNLPETAQLLYLRLYRHLWQEGQSFIGSVRKLSRLVHLSKSTVDRMLKKLKEARLINIEYQESRETSQEVMTVTVNKQALWDLNRSYHDDPSSVPNWDTKLPDCPKLGQHDVSLGQRVPDSRSNQDTIHPHTHKHFTQQKNAAEATSPAVSVKVVASALSSLLEQLTEEEIVLAMKIMHEQRQHHAQLTTVMGGQPPGETDTRSSMQTHAQPVTTQPPSATKPTKPTKRARSLKTLIPEPKEPAIVLDPRPQAVFAAWASLPWFRGVAPRLTSTVAEHCTALAAYEPLPTAEDMLKTRRWYEKKYPQRKGWYLGNFVSAYPQYLSDQYQAGQERDGGGQPARAVVLNDDTLVYWNPEGNRKCFNSLIWNWMPYAEAVQYGYTPEQKLKEAEVAMHEERKAFRREIEERKALRAVQATG